MPTADGKTNAMRALEARRIPYDAYRYDPALHSAVAVAAALALPTEVVYKTLVVLPDAGRPLLVMVAGPAEIGPRQLAASLGLKSVRMAPQTEAERLTGLPVGGIGALALLGKPFTVCLDRAALRHERILVNGGRRGLNLRLTVRDLLAVTSARVVDAVAPAAPRSTGVEQPE